ncbi:hypothetical protein SOV_30230 [Sporomusa ovata DSM 2662]|uniref:Uncharacterized protein n=1 Tax=Sporomusa ovata TaxID=2378 RepID=A0A0U1KRY9_9FIRM|nr:hypothetical protein [Sporomusa ovata]EQB24992.1 hypothetical protein SOV_5c01260 [Sporomusa ovata DSM 2662]CQR70196.1 hypothetical protein SpAn4DRAFT_4708 [Sporomusa ovata]
MRGDNIHIKEVPASVSVITADDLAKANVKPLTRHYTMYQACM